MRAHMLSMLSLTPPSQPTVPYWIEEPVLPRPQAKTSSKRGRLALPRPVSLSKLLHKTAIHLHP